MLASSQAFSSRCVLVREGQTTSCFSELRRGLSVFTVCVSEWVCVCVPFLLLLQLVGFQLKSTNFLFPLLPLLTLLFHHFFNPHHLLLFSCCLFRGQMVFIATFLLLLCSSLPPVLTPVTAGWSCGAMCRAWPRVFRDGSWPSRAEPPASHDCLLSAHQPSLPLVLF